MKVNTSNFDSKSISKKELIIQILLFCIVIIPGVVYTIYLLLR